MFTRLFLTIFIAIVSAVLISILLLDDLYIQGIKKDELVNTRGIKQVVFADVLLAKSNQDEKLKYWSERFSYQFSLKETNELNLQKNQISELITNKVFVDITSDWTTDDITVYYYSASCNCTLVMEKYFVSDDAFKAYLQGFLLIIISALAFIIFLYVNSHKKQMKKLIKVQQQYGAGQFDIKADTHVAMPYTLLATNFNLMTKQISLLQQEQKNLINGVSHDLKTPIARLRFALDLTRNCHTVSQYQNQIQNMDLDLDELDDLVTQWLFYAELNGKPEAIIKEAVHFADLVNHIANKIKVLYPHIQLDLNLQQGNIQAEPRLLSRAIENLIVNSFKFTQSHVSITLKFNVTSITFKIEDDGAGITEAQKNKIIQPFVKLDNSRSSSGFGLGLAIVKSILEQHDSQLEIKASSKGGACFIIHFPITQ
ncbi:ATP-binding protein [Pseudoalteromonas denitrificans]|uniref:histidine kinase n=1 Tax=Pseudoalteromonas denitrificans DSM 6059 TaxID=1123010 RepID=A0A1I1PI21_9GAMM|nr:ATP-binding protein [Pseudoalteromonas denitrificans]SFD09481.1 Signal transduction histidine kinase [Pseudoalteromonas denitrificans DSM 6059]